MKRLAFVIPALAVLGCSTSAPGRGRLTVAVSIEPEAFLVEGIAGDLADIVVVVPPGADPHGFEPSPATMQAVSEADLYLAVGLPFEEQWLPRIEGSAPGLTVARIDSGLVRTSDGDPYVWLSPDMMRVLAANTERQLRRMAPADSAAFADGLAGTLAVIDSTDARVSDILEGCEGATFVALHPAYAYFAREYSLVQVALEVEGAEPTPVQLSEIVEAARAGSSRIVIVSPGFSTGAAEALSIELGFEPRPHDQLSRDWPGCMTGLASLIAGEE